MIFKSKELVNVPDRGEMPVWSVDTDTQTVTHVHPKTFKTEEHRFFRDYIRYHLHYSEEENPERLQRLVDNGRYFSISLTLTTGCSTLLTVRRSF